MKRSVLSVSFQPVIRAVMVISAVAVMATGVTFAALQSQQATLTGNSIKTANADLRIGTSATSFAASRVGFEFNGIIPGSAPSPAEANNFYLKNYGDTPLVLKASIGSVPTNTAGVDLDKVHVVLTRVDTGKVEKHSLAALVAGQTGGGVAFTEALDGGVVAQFKFQVSMDADAFSGQNAAIGGIDLVFAGTPAN